LELEAGLEAALLFGGDGVLDPQAVQHMPIANVATPLRKNDEFMAVPFGNVRGTGSREAVTNSRSADNGQFFLGRHRFLKVSTYSVYPVAGGESVSCVDQSSAT
jgi:hypothetical protein